MNAPVLSMDDVCKSFDKRSMWRSTPMTYAVQDVTLELHEGETLALVGESGSGKSTLGRLAMGLLPATSGTIRFRQQPVDGMSRRELQEFRRTVQIVFQDSSAAFNPRRSVFQTLAEPLKLHAQLSDEELDERVDDLLETVGLSPASAFRDALSHQLSGGQRQRVMIARALSVDPTFVVADEPLSALDVTVQAQILDLLLRLQRERGIGYLLITHDLALVSEIADKVVVMYQGRIVERGSAAEVCSSSRHPYTRLLMASTLSGDPADRRIVLGEPQEAPKFARPAPSSGCSFAPRCPLVTERCSKEVPALRTVDDHGTQVACHVI